MTEPAIAAVWRLRVTDAAAKQLKKLDQQTARRIAAALADTVASGDPRVRGKALSGPLGGYWRYRVGDYRVICEISDGELLVLVLQVGHRSSIYAD